MAILDQPKREDAINHFRLEGAGEGGGYISLQGWRWRGSVGSWVIMFSGSDHPSPPPSSMIQEFDWIEPLLHKHCIINEESIIRCDWF